MSSFKKYKCLTISEKKKVIETIEEGERKVDVAKAFKIALNSLPTILKNKEKIFSAFSSRVRKRVSKGNFPHLEQCLVSWMRQCRGQNIPICGSLLKEKARAFAKELGIEFSASEGWLTNFKKRNGIVFKKMCGESSSVDINVCSKWQNSLSDLIKNCFQDKSVATVAEWYRYRIVACLVTSLSPVPLKTHRVGQRCTLNLSKAETSSRWCGVVVRRGGASLDVVHIT
ncbi:tigger transposable element-derived protein 4 [Trichonephila clavipes]|nr:tigger transposable element-derived protein 4 [Trichonephila clavipes]